MAFDRNGNVTLTNPQSVTPEAPTAYIPAVNLSAPGAIGGGTPSTGAFTTLTTTGAATIAGALAADGGITVDTSAFTVANATGNTAIGGTLAVTGATTLSGLLNADAGIAVDTSAFTVANTSGNTAIGGTLEVTGATTLTGAATLAAVLTLTTGLKITATSRTATADGTGNGTIAAGVSFVVAANGGSADNIIVLPAPVVGHIVMIYTTGALELRSSTPASIAINGGTGASAESALASGSLIIAICVTTTAWLALEIESNGTVSGVEAAA